MSLFIYSTRERAIGNRVCVYIKSRGWGCCLIYSDGAERCAAEGGGPPPSVVVVVYRHDSKKDYIENRLNYRLSSLYRALFYDAICLPSIPCISPKKQRSAAAQQCHIDKDQTLFLLKTKEKRESTKWKNIRGETLDRCMHMCF